MSHVIATEASGRRLSQLSGPILGPLDCDVRQTRCVKGVFKSQCVHPKVGGSDRDPGVSQGASVRTLFFGLCPGQCPLWPAACGHPSAPREPRVTRGPRCWAAIPALPPSPQLRPARPPRCKSEWRRPSFLKLTHFLIPVHIFFPLRFAQHFSFQTLGPQFTPLASAELQGGHRCMRRLRPRSRLGGSSQAGAGVPGQRAPAAGGVGPWRAQREARGTHGACRAPWLRWGYSEGTRRGPRRAPDPEFGLSATHACSVWWVYTFTLQ